MDAADRFPSADDLERMSQAELDQLPFGVLELDEQGVIRHINSYEANRTRRTGEEFLGRNFFSEVAPCTNVQAFAEVFREGARKGSLQRSFRFTYTLPAGRQDVFIRLASHRPGYGWVLALTLPPEQAGPG